VPLRLRLPKDIPQRKQQSARPQNRRGFKEFSRSSSFSSTSSIRPILADEEDDDFGCSPDSRELAAPSSERTDESAQQKQFKKSIDTRKANPVSGRSVPKETKNFCPVGFFVCSDPNDRQKTNPNTTGKEKEHIHVFIESS
jgi:hypothetical protein